EDRQHAARFARPAAGNDAKDGGLGRNRMPDPEGGSVAAHRARLDRRVADEGAGDAVLGEECGLEGKQRHDVGDALTELPRPAWPPGPQLRRDIMHDRNTRAAEMMSEAETKARRIDRHDG